LADRRRSGSRGQVALRLGDGQREMSPWRRRSTTPSRRDSAVHSSAAEAIVLQATSRRCPSRGAADCSATSRRRHPANRGSQRSRGGDHHRLPVGADRLRGLQTSGSDLDLATSSPARPCGLRHLGRRRGGVSLATLDRSRPRYSKSATTAAALHNKATCAGRRARSTSSGRAGRPQRRQAARRQSAPAELDHFLLIQEPQLPKPDAHPAPAGSRSAPRGLPRSSSSEG